MAKDKDKDSGEFETIAELEQFLIRRALERHGSDKAAVLAALGITSRELTLKANKYGITLPWTRKRH